ncbi:replicative DNA helicase [Sutcliffiella horikoshii]|uniref:Replicative DNA helicase n=1 Tax=Sutcliffiella horikoshii TaxID=79883 RepID=A0A5D4SZ19_9BACI|nr:replicative DNA helicase [Sutcliffiella horikoshii]TYS68680.1 replicative DNA helicase [Sutcliffiella horikoshii]
MDRVINYEAECAILGCILIDSTIMSEITLKTEHFQHYQNKELFIAMKEIADKDQPINAITIIEQIGRHNLNRIGGTAHLSLLKESVPSVHGFKNYESSVIEAWKKINIHNILKPVVDNPEFNTTEIQKVIKQLNDIDKTGTKEKFDLNQHLVQMYELPLIKVEKGYSGIPSGFMDLDDMTDGFQDEDSIIFGARPSMGKTAFILNIAANAGFKGAIPVIFSLEMSAESLIKRMLCLLGGIQGIKARKPYHYFDDNDRQNWVTAIGILERIKLQIFDKTGQTINEMRAHVRDVKRENPDKKILVMIDYLTLIKAEESHNGNAHLQVSEISSNLKGMAKEFKCPVITLAQLSRGVEQRANKRPVMSDLRESGSIEQDADIIGFLYRDEYYDAESDKKNILEVDIAKQRNGPTGKVDIYYNKETQRMRDLHQKNAN